jgi:hypothetical protein
LDLFCKPIPIAFGTSAQLITRGFHDGDCDFSQ